MTWNVQLEGALLPDGVARDEWQALTGAAVQTLTGDRRLLVGNSLKYLLR